MRGGRSRTGLPSGRCFMYWAISSACSASAWLWRSLASTYNIWYSANGIRIEARPIVTTCRSTIRDTTERVRMALLPFCDHVAHAADRVDLRIGSGLDQLLANAMDVNLDGVRPDIVGNPEQLILHQLLWNDTPVPPHQDLEDGNFARRKGSRRARDGHLARLGVQDHISDIERASEQISRPAQQRVQPRDQLLESEGLAQIIVGANLQSFHAILEAAARCQDQNGSCDPALSHLAKDVEPIVVRKPEVEHHGRIPGSHHGLVSLGCGRHRVDLEPGAAEPLREQRRQALVILHQQQSHSRPTSGQKQWGTRRALLQG